MLFLFPRDTFTLVPCPQSYATKQLPPAQGSAPLPTFPLPQFPWEVRQLPALTFLAADGLQLQEQPQKEQEEAAGRHGDRQSCRLSGRGGAAEHSPSSKNAALGHTALPQERALGQLSNALTREADAHTWLFKSCCRKAWNKVPLSSSH